jgi:hypothetical protein
MRNSLVWGKRKGMFRKGMFNELGCRLRKGQARNMGRVI